MQVALRLKKSCSVSCWVVTLLFLIVITARGQSTDITTPTSVTTSDIGGTISARDLGDARLTQHFYAFAGMPGDVLITIKSNNLNGDVDIFTAGTLRPLLKFGLYAESTSPATKGIYLRRRTDFVLRVEARTPNDNEGSYQVRFGGSFEPLALPLLAEADTTGAAKEPLPREGKKGRRVSSVGARIEEPEPPAEQVAAIPPTETPSPEPTPEPASEPTSEPAAESEAPKTTPPRRGRGRASARRPPARTTTVETTETDKKVEESAENAEAEKPPTGIATRTTPPPRRGRRGARAAAALPVEPEPPSGPRLILELLDGTRVEQFMMMIRRVTIENNQIVVVLKDGKVDRTRMSEVVKMSIEP